MSKKTLHPTKDFISLYEEAEKNRLLISEFLSKATGYNLSWCEKNFTNCLKLLNKEQKKEVNIIILRAQVVKKYLWDQFFYKEFDLVKSALESPIGKVAYNPKKKLIEIDDGSQLQQELSALKNNVMKKIQDKLSKFFPKDIKQI